MSPPRCGPCRTACSHPSSSGQVYKRPSTTRPRCHHSASLRAIELTAYLVAAGHPEPRLAYGDGQLVITIAGPPTEHAAVRVAALDGDVVLIGDTATVRIPVPE